MERVASWLTPIAALVLIILLAVTGPNLSRPNLQLFTLTLMWIALASSWNMIGGYAGYAV
jgi:ABC-type branched-subunit amino acid transport system permease subunit